MRRALVCGDHNDFATAVDFNLKWCVPGGFDRCCTEILAMQVSFVPPEFPRSLQDVTQEAVGAANVEMFIGGRRANC